MELGPIGIVGFGAFAIVVLLWLVISFRESGPGRNVLEWLGATHLFIALGSFFLYLVLEARADESTVRLVAFGFLLLVFSIGFIVSLVHTLRALAGGGASEGDGTTH
jgi:hypothetical protein